MAASKFLKLQTNIPVVGVIKYVDFQPTTNPDYKDQISVRGSWEGHEGEPRIYLPIALEARLQELGIIGVKQENGNYPLKIAGAKIRINKSENGRSKLTTIELLNGSAPTGTTATPGTASSAPSNTGGPYTPATTATGADARRVHWDEVTETMRRCYTEAENLITGMGYESPDLCEVQSCAHSLFIQSARENLWNVQPSSAGSQGRFVNDEQKMAIAELFIKLHMDADAAKADLKSRFGFESIDKLTEGNAEALISALKTTLGAKADVPF